MAEELLCMLLRKDVELGLIVRMGREFSKGMALGMIVGYRVGLGMSGILGLLFGGLPLPRGLAEE